MPSSSDREFASEKTLADTRPYRVPRISFHQPEISSHLLHLLLQNVSVKLRHAILTLLGTVPDPDSAILFMERLLQDSSARDLLDRSPFSTYYAVTIFGRSPFLGETLVQNPDVLADLVHERTLDRSFSADEWQRRLTKFRDTADRKELSANLALFKRREYIRIALRDALKIAPLAETTAEISALADVLIAAALHEAQQRLVHRYDKPLHVDGTRHAATPFAILSLGKLGGNELNYSSDIDLLYIFGDGEEPAGAPISNREYFVRLAQQVTAILSELTPSGPLFRIDLRLRPQGGEGEPAISLSHALRYYAASAHEWEKQALIKLRHSAGDVELSRALIRGVRPCIYGLWNEQSKQPHLNFGAIDTSLAARERSHRQRAGRTGTIDVKLDRGGIRDIEFLAQSLQRVYGGAQPWLRPSGTLLALQTLHDKGHLDGHDFRRLSKTYEFLRRIEHFLQLRRGQQTHRLPATTVELEIARRAMQGYGASSRELPAQVQDKMEGVAEICARVLAEQRGREFPLGTKLELQGPYPTGLGEASNRRLLEALAVNAPAIHHLATRADLNPVARKNLFRFLDSAFTSSARFEIVAAHPKALESALCLFEGSEYLSQILIRHPEEIATLSELNCAPARAGSGYLFEQPGAGARASHDPVLDHLVSWDLPHTEKLAVLRRHCLHRIFAVGATDLLEVRSVYHSLGLTTAIAEDAVRCALGLAGESNGLAVMALGRLGSGEFDVLSDADLLFVCEEGADLVALTKSAERMMHALAAHTREGTVFPVDTRLRPHGREGSLLVTTPQLLAYFEHDAQPWEVLSFTKVRFVAGSPRLADRARGAVQYLFACFAADPEFPAAASQMRRKLEREGKSERSIKTSPGTLYDLDFLLGTLAVRHGGTRSGNLRDRIWECCAAGDLNKADAAALDHAAELFRTTEHAVRLVTGRADKWLPQNDHARDAVERLAARTLGQNACSAGLEIELEQNAAVVREMYLRVLGAAG